LIRDKLAAHRNLLAAERTLLAYIRTALGFGAVGFTMLKFFGETPLFQILGWVFLPLGGVITVIGFLRYFQSRRIIARLYHQEPERKKPDLFE
jgi:putative membrane protein